MYTCRQAGHHHRLFQDIEKFAPKNLPRDTCLPACSWRRRISTAHKGDVSTNDPIKSITNKAAPQCPFAKGGVIDAAGDWKARVCAVFGPENTLRTTPSSFNTSIRLIANQSRLDTCPTACCTAKFLRLI
jgi:hypothetical protein